MFKFIRFLLLMTMLFASYSAHAILSMELTRGVAGAVPIAVVPFATGGAMPSQDVAGIVGNDLQNSGRFKVFGRNALTETPSSAANVSANYFHRLGTDNVVIGNVSAIGGGRYTVSFQLLDLLNGQGASSIVLNKKYTVSERELRAVAHHISDLIYQQITGVRGVFSTRIAYVVVQRSPGMPTRHILE